jgi:cytochrome P450
MTSAATLSPIRPRLLATWALAHGLPRVALKAASRRGDAIAGTAADPTIRADPFATYDRIREQCVIVHGKLLSATARHAVANEILRSDAFSVGPGDMGSPRLNRLMWRLVDSSVPGPIEPPSLLAVDPPVHTRLRRPVSRVFTARAMNGLRPRIRELADELLDRVADQPRFDLVANYAKVLPLTMIAEILGVPERLRGQVQGFADSASQALDPGLSLRQFREVDAAVRQAHVTIGQHIADLRSSPGTDLLSQLATMDGDDRLSDVELRATALLTIGAGFETTVNLIANAVVNLLAHPEQLAALRADPSGWENAVEEVLRYDSPVQVTLRSAKREVDVAGVSLRQGTPVLVILAGANRDPVVFDDPHRFDVTRANAREHLSFSAGVHFCVGAMLARLESAIALEALFERLPDLAIAGTPVRRGTRVLRGYDYLPVSSAVSARA